MKRLLVALAISMTGCNPLTLSHPGAPLAAPGLPDDRRGEAERLDAACARTETDLAFTYQEGKEEQDQFKTILGSITGSVTTAGGIAAAIGGLVASKDDVSLITGVTGFVSGGLGAIGTVVTSVYVPGKDKMDGAAERQARIEKARADAAKAASADDPEAWDRAAKELAAACAP
ncbi:MAG: hypothetical protein U0271_30155 [Polyangiaceae bacterium]